MTLTRRKNSIPTSPPHAPRESKSPCWKDPNAASKPPERPAFVAVQFREGESATETNTMSRARADPLERLVKDLSRLGHSDDAEACYKGTCVCERTIRARITAYLMIHGAPNQ